mmetsp:Transcript_53730/g.156143  ORF Transcript_53730/g.156143 Transcript_53730/m.156143 type:complete len:266 (-) Transcript_53730:151-948(-)
MSAPTASPTSSAPVGRRVVPPPRAKRLRAPTGSPARPAAPGPAAPVTSPRRTEELEDAGARIVSPTFVSPTSPAEQLPQGPEAPKLELPPPARQCGGCATAERESEDEEGAGWWRGSEEDPNEALSEWVRWPPWVQGHTAEANDAAAEQAAAADRLPPLHEAGATEDIALIGKRKRTSQDSQSVDDSDPLFGFLRDLSEDDELNGVFAAMQESLQESSLLQASAHQALPGSNRRPVYYFHFAKDELLLRVDFGAERKMIVVLARV